MATRFLDPATGRELPCCRECGSVPVQRDGRWTCSSCGYVAGKMLAALHLEAAARVHVQCASDALKLALAEARDEGYEAGRRDALEEVARVVDVIISEYRCGKLRITDWTANEVIRRIRALAGKL